MSSLLSYTPALSTSGQPLPPPPSRAQLCQGQVGFNTLVVTIPGYGTIPWFEPFLLSLNRSQRQVIYDAKHAAGDTHAVLAVSYNYPGYPVPGVDYTDHLDDFVTLAAEVIREGFYPFVSFASDGQVFNSDGWTYGWQWGVDHMQDLVNALQTSVPGVDLTEYCLLFGGFELLGPGGNWSPDQLEQYYLQLRSLLPNGCVALELGSGYCKWQEDGVACWSSPAGQAIDVFLQEFPQPIDQNWDGCQQLASRMLGGAATHISPPNVGPWYTAQPTPRGPVYTWAFEYALNQLVHGSMTPQQALADRAQLQTLGYTSVG